VDHLFNLDLRQFRRFGWSMNRLFVRMTTQAGTRRFDFIFLSSLFFLPHGLFRAI